MRKSEAEIGTALVSKHMTALIRDSRAENLEDMAVLQSLVMTVMGTWMHEYDMTTVDVATMCGVLMATVIKMSEEGKGTTVNISDKMN